MGTLVFGIDDVLFDTAFWPYTTTPFCEYQLGAREQVDYFRSAVFPVLGSTTKGLALPLSIPEPSSKVCFQQQMNSEPSVRLQPRCSSQAVLSKGVSVRELPPHGDCAHLDHSLSVSVSSEVRRASQSVITSSAGAMWIALPLPPPKYVGVSIGLCLCIKLNGDWGGDGALAPPPLLRGPKQVLRVWCRYLIFCTLGKCGELIKLFFFESAGGK